MAIRGNYREEVNRLIDKLQHITAHTNFRQPITTFTGIKPITPDDAEYESKTTELMNGRK